MHESQPSKTPSSESLSLDDQKEFPSDKSLSNNPVPSLVASNSQDFELDQQASSSSISKPLADEKKKSLLQGCENKILLYQSNEEKIRVSLNFMRENLESKTPHIREFWDIKRQCLSFFKEKLDISKRAILWNEYRELCQEAARLKELLEEQSSFALEQIALAIQAMEEELASFDKQLEKMPEISFLNGLELLGDSYHYFQTEQKKLNLLNVYASRINSLRKELVKTEMRIRKKNLFFQKLSELGDRVFPRRKDIITDISKTFSELVKAFVSENFKQERFLKPSYILRQEIKDLQATAKTLTLNTQVFTHTRMLLSQMWDKIKDVEKEKKKKRLQKKLETKENCSEVLEKIKVFSSENDPKSSTWPKINEALDVIFAFAKTQDLSQQDWRLIKSEIAKVKKPFYEEFKKQELLYQEQKAKAEEERKKAVDLVKNDCLSLLESSDDLKDFVQLQEQLSSKISTFSLTKNEKLEFKNLQMSLRDKIAEKKEASLMKLPQGDKEAIFQLKDILKQRKERKTEIKKQLEDLRKAAGSSGLDFEKAMKYKEQIQVEKNRLSHIEKGIVEIENKIQSFNLENIA